MDKKKLLIIGGTLLVAGVGAGIYFWKKSKYSNVEESKEEVKEKKADIPKGEKAQILRVKENFQARKEIKPTLIDIEFEEKKPASASETPAPASETPTPVKTLNTRKEKRQACGLKPLPIQKKKRAEWQKCVDAGGEASFEGDFDEFERDYMDFQGVGSYSSFQSQFDIDLDL